MEFFLLFINLLFYVVSISHLAFNYTNFFYDSKELAPYLFTLINLIHFLPLPLHLRKKKDLIIKQVATTISATVTWDVAEIHKIGWGWTGVIWLYNIAVYIFLDPIKFAVRYALSGRAWALVFNKRVSLINIFLVIKINVTVIFAI